MRLGIIFPNEKSFYMGMGAEIYDNFPEVRKIYKEAERITKTDFKSGLIYEQEDFEWDKKNRRIAVLLTSVAHFEVWKATYKIEPQALLGDKIGLLSACVCTGSIPLEKAIKIICSDDWKYRFMTCKRKKETYKILGTMSKCLSDQLDADDLIKYAVEEKLECLLEIGPDCLFTKEINNVDYENKPMAVYFDISSDREFILENLEYQKYFNYRYALRRMLGIAVATQNYNASTDNDALIYDSYSALKVYNDEVRTKEQRGMFVMVKEGDIDLCIKELNLILKYKNVPRAEVRERIELLQNETAIDFKSKFKEWFE